MTKPHAAAVRAAEAIAESGGWSTEENCCREDANRIEREYQPLVDAVEGMICGVCDNRVGFYISGLNCSGCKATREALRGVVEGK